MDLFDLVAKITLDSSEYENGLDGASKKASGFGATLGTAAKVGGAAIAAVGTAAVAMTGAFVSGASSVAAYGDNIDKASQKMGISAEAYQEWDAILQHSGTSIDAMTRGMQTLQKNAVSSADKFEQLGITQEQLASMSTEELFAATIEGLQSMGEGAERTALASELLGGSAKELGALLNTSAEDTEAMRQRVHELGGVMSDEAVKAAAKYQDSLQDMKTSFDGLKRGMMSEFLPAITSVMDGLTDIFSGGGTEKISEGIGMFVDKISEVVPRLVETGSAIILSLAQSISANLPTLLSAAGQAIITIAKGLIEQLPLIIKSGLEVIVSLATGIAESLPELIPTIVDVVLQIVETLTSPDSIGALIDAALALILGLAEGFINAIPRLIESLPIIITNVITALMNAVPQIAEAGVKLLVSLVKNLPQIIVAVVKGIGQILVGMFKAVDEGWDRMAEAGKNLLRGLWDGIVGAADWLWQQISGWLSGLWNGILGFFGIKSPSKEMAWVGEMLVAGLTNSIQDNGDEAIAAAEQMSEDVLSAFDRLNNAEIGSDISVNRNISDSFRGLESAVDNARTTAQRNSRFGGEDGVINIVVQSILDGKIIGETAYKYQRNMARAMG